MHAVQIEHWSLWALIARLTAGALGLSHSPVQCMRGRSVGEEAARRGELLDVPGDSGSSTCLVSALRPDVVLLHGPPLTTSATSCSPRPTARARWVPWQQPAVSW
jgi:acyl CoA:acetate/3-ketoacid CoA transferase alpha subunit